MPIRALVIPIRSGGYANSALEQEGSCSICTEQLQIKFSTTSRKEEQMKEQNFQKTLKPSPTPEPSTRSFGFQKYGIRKPYKEKRLPRSNESFILGECWTAAARIPLKSLQNVLPTHRKICWQTDRDTLAYAAKELGTITPCFAKQMKSYEKSHPRPDSLILRHRHG